MVHQRPPMYKTIERGQEASVAITKEFDLPHTKILFIVFHYRWVFRLFLLQQYLHHQCNDLGRIDQSQSHQPSRHCHR